MAERIILPRTKVTLLPDTPNRDTNPKITTFIGTKESGGTASPGVLYEDIDVNDEDGLFMANSNLANMIRNFRKVNKVSQVNAIAGGIVGNQAEGAIDFTGSTATEDGELIVRIGSLDDEHEVTVSISDTDDATAIGDSLVAAITAKETMIASGGNTAGDVELVSESVGLMSNGIGIIVEGTVAGVTYSLTEFTGGTGSVVTTAVLPLIDYKTDIVMAYDESVATVKTWLDGRFNSENKVLDGIIITGKDDTESNLSVIGDALNSQSLIIVGDKTVAKSDKIGASFFNKPENKASRVAGLRALRFNTGSDISDIMTVREPLDNIGGVHTASLPYFNTAVTGVAVSPRGEGFTDAEILDLTDAGISYIGNNDARTTVIMGELVTTYKKDNPGNDDDTYKFLNYVDSASLCREYIWNNLKIDYAQKRLTLGKGQAGRSYATRGGVRSDMLKYYTDLSSADYTLLQGGAVEETGKTIGDYFKEALTVTFDVRAGLITITGILPLVTQTRDIQAPLSMQ